jgi:hypothetical protein
MSTTAYIAFLSVVKASMTSMLKTLQRRHAQSTKEESESNVNEHFPWCENCTAKSELMTSNL